jgi:hypothetical protein
MAIGGALHVHDVFLMRADTAQEAEHGLDEQRSLHQTFGPEVMQIVDVAGVIALELIARAGRVERFQRVTDVLERIAEDEIVGAFQHRRLPVVLELLVSLEHREQAEIHRPHVQAGDLRLPHRRGLDPLLDGHIGRAAGREIHDHVGSLLDNWQKRLEGLRRLVGPAVYRIAGMKMHDRGTRLGRAESGFRDLRRRHREVRRHRGGVDRARDCAGNDDLTCRHGVFLLQGAFSRCEVRASAREATRSLSNG